MAWVPAARQRQPPWPSPIPGAGGAHSLRLAPERLQAASPFLGRRTWTAWPSELPAEIRTPPPPPRSSTEAWPLPHRLPPPATSRRIPSPAVDGCPRLGGGCPVSESQGSSAAVRRTSRSGPKGGPVETGMSLEAERVTSLGKDWHRPCLKCEKCGKTLTSGGHAEHEGKPYCNHPCYAAMFGPKGFGRGGAESHTFK
ncbi:cysteine-rich protein 1 isoform X1 [Muntiacus reevesi]|uniref:cysteine-rich protein 1 isoform X1 n=1 Tax=Muntiacus reevesi TaxID=9886 RepID=UPI0033077888